MKLHLGNIIINFSDKPFLGPIEANFESGHLNLIVGRSGCGKSTLLKLIAGFHSDYTGAITLDEDYFEPEGNVALAFQNPETLFFNSSVFEEISYSLTVSGKKENIKEITHSWMTNWGLNPELFDNKYPFRLSGGEKRRVALAACTILQPKIILLDEPLAGLDRVGQKDLSQIIESLSQDHIVIVVTHEPELLMQKDTKILFLNEQSTGEFRYNSFISNALQNPEFYPLPNWYYNCLNPYSNRRIDFPLINAKSVADFIKYNIDESN